jgi:hypothetical protein
VESMAVPCNDPHWDYQHPAMLATRKYMLTWLHAGLQTSSNRTVNFDKLREITPRLTENPTDFSGCLTEAFTHYTKLGPSSKDEVIILNSHFISQCFSDIWKKT